MTKTHRTVEFDVIGPTFGHYVLDLIDQLRKVEDALLADGTSDVSLRRDVTPEARAAVLENFPNWIHRVANFTFESGKVPPKAVVRAALQEATYAIVMTAERNFGPTRV